MPGQNITFSITGGEEDLRGMENSMDIIYSLNDGFPGMGKQIFFKFQILRTNVFQKYIFIQKNIDFN